MSLALAVVATVLASTASASADTALVAPVRAVNAYLEALLAAAPPRPARARRRADRGIEARPDDPRWARLRSLVAPAPAGESGTAATHRAALLEPWHELGPDGALVGYQLLSVRRTSSGAAVVNVSERVVHTGDTSAVARSCAYVVVPVLAQWLLAAKRCDVEGAVQAGADDPP